MDIWVRRRRTGRHWIEGRSHYWDFAGRLQVGVHAKTLTVRGEATKWLHTKNFPIGDIQGVTLRKDSIWLDLWSGAHVHIATLLPPPINIDELVEGIRQAISHRTP